MDLGGKSDPYCILEVGKQKIQTNYKQSTLNPYWDEAFTFEIESKGQVLNAIVMDKDSIGKDDFEGSSQIPISIFSDQLSHDQWFDLQGVTPGSGQCGRIHLIIQWI